jgi:hypothetical protein
MTDQQNHLQSAVKQRNTLIEEMNQLNSTLNIKREQATKFQGIIEYLNGIGVILPEEPKETVTQTEVVED